MENMNKSDVIYQSSFFMNFPDSSEKDLQKNQDLPFFQTILEVLKSEGWFSIFNEASESIVPFYSEMKNEYDKLLGNWTTFRIPWGIDIEATLAVGIPEKLTNDHTILVNPVLQFYHLTKDNLCAPSDLQIYLSSGNIMCRIIKLNSLPYSPSQLITLVGIKGNPSSVKRMEHSFINKEEYENVLIRFGNDFAKLMSTIEL